jgi:ferredoxin-type protein NapH
MQYNQVKKNFWRSNKWLILRRLSQLLILVIFLLGPWLSIWIIEGTLANSLLLDMIPLADPLLALQVLVATGSFTSTLFIGVTIVTVFYALIGGRIFCSWVCPINPITDTAHWLRNKFVIKGGANLGRDLRYWILAMVLIVSFITSSLAWEIVNPVSILHRGLFFGMGLGWLTIIGIFLFDLLFAERGWCTHLCPMGALYALIGRFSLLRIRTEASKCDQCGDCFYTCPEPHVITPAIKIGGDITILNNECTNCGRCIDVCHTNVFSFGTRQHKQLQENN